MGEWMPTEGGNKGVVKFKVKAKNMQVGRTYRFTPDEHLARERGTTELVVVDSIEVEGDDVYVGGTWTHDTVVTQGFGTFDRNEQVEEVQR